MSSALHLVFFGNDESSLIILEAILTCCTPNAVPNPETKVPLVSRLEIITSSNETNIYKYCKKSNIPYLLWGDISSSQFLGADIGVIAAFGKMLPEDLINIFRLGIINVHPSLIPRWRGSSPISYSILHSDKVVGVTILQTNPKKFDDGKILLQRSIEIDPTYHNQKSLMNLLLNNGAKMLLEVLGDIELYQSRSYAQSTEGVTVAKKITKELTKINWISQTSKDIDVVYRAAGHMFPLHSHFVYGEGILLPVELYEMVPSWRIPPDTEAYLATAYANRDAVIGSTFFFKRPPGKCFYVRCADSWVGFGAICIGKQENRRKRLNAYDFWNSYLKGLPLSAVVFR